MGSQQLHVDIYGYILPFLKLFSCSQKCFHPPPSDPDMMTNTTLEAKIWIRLYPVCWNKFVRLQFCQAPRTSLKGGKFNLYLVLNTHSDSSHPRFTDIKLNFESKQWVHSLHSQLVRELLVKLIFEEWQNLKIDAQRTLGNNFVTFCIVPNCGTMLNGTKISNSSLNDNNTLCLKTHSIWDSNPEDLVLLITSQARYHWTTVQNNVRAS